MSDRQPQPAQAPEGTAAGQEDRERDTPRLPSERLEGAEARLLGHHQVLMLDAEEQGEHPRKDPQSR